MVSQNLQERAAVELIAEWAKTSLRFCFVLLHFLVWTPFSLRQKHRGKTASTALGVFVP